VATISINGESERVDAGKAFPAANPVFRLVKVKAGSAEIGIVGGSYQSGGATLTLKKGKTVTLMNTADGTRYELKLISTP
jgi:hypothetical protein